MVIVLATAMPANATAKPGYSVFKAERKAELHLDGSNGYRLDVTAVRAPGDHRGQIDVVAHKGSGSVSYNVPGSLGRDGSIDARLPHVGRIAVRFESRKVGQGITLPGICRGRPEVVQRGIFRGTIELHGEKEFTEVDRGSARGSVTRVFRRVCHVGAHGAGKTHRPKVRLTYLIAGEQKGKGGLHFAAFRAEFGTELDILAFSASTIRQQEGMEIVNSVSAEGNPDQLLVSKPGTPKVVEVKPPEPFQGTATFHLTSKTASTWEGNLSVELPGVGPVSLAGTDFWSALCSEKHCTRTPPPGSHYEFQTIVGAGLSG
jgi:hypothetical protein